MVSAWREMDGGLDTWDGAQLAAASLRMVAVPVVPAVPVVIGKQCAGADAPMPAVVLASGTARDQRTTLFC